MVKAGMIVLGALVCTAIVLVAAVVLTGRGSEPHMVLGYTSQDKLINASLRHGRVFRFGTKIDARCPNNQHWTTVWWPTVSDGATYGNEGNLVRLHVKRDTTVNWTVTEDLHLDARTDHDLVTGTVQATVTVKEPFQATCSSGPVRFYAATSR
jgi:hypothetical protein